LRDKDVARRDVGHVHRVDDGAAVDRYPEAHRLLNHAGAMTLDITRFLDARRSRFVFERTRTRTDEG